MRRKRTGSFLCFALALLLLPLAACKNKSGADGEAVAPTILEGKEFPWPAETKGSSALRPGIKTHCTPAVFNRQARQVESYDCCNLYTDAKGKQTLDLYHCARVALKDMPR